MTSPCPALGIHQSGYRHARDQLIWVADYDDQIDRASEANNEALVAELEAERAKRIKALNTLPEHL